MLKVKKVLINLFFLQILVASSVYSGLYYLGFSTKDSLLSNIINLLLSCGFLIVGIINFNLNRKFLRFPPIAFFLTLILIGLFVSLVFNSPAEYLPSAVRFLGYPLSALIGYSFIRDYGSEVFRKKLRLFLKLSIILILFFGFLEIVLDDVAFLNGAYRLSGPFKHHQLGFALYIFVIIVLFNSVFRFSVLKIIVLLLLLFLFFGTHSRALIVILFVAYFFLYLGKIRNLQKASFFIISGAIVVFAFYYGVVNTEYFPRLKEVFIGTSTLKDPSTLERIEIFNHSLRNIHGFETLFGIGLGGFNEFYYEVTGRHGVAAHNNYLLFFIETGIFGLILYLLFQFIFVIKLFFSSRRHDTWILNSALVLFISIEIFSFLQNNYYFYASEHLVWLIFGASIYQFKGGANRNSDL